MARRMFSTEIVDSDAFLDMPESSQNLYFHLGVRADDDGFISPKKVMRLTGAGDDDLKILLAKRFVLAFESGVIVIKHWLIHNLIRKDRYTPTRYIEEKKLLRVKENGAYTEAVSWQPNGNQMATNGCRRLGKDSIGKDSKEEREKNKGRFAPPSLPEVSSYCLERKNKVDPQKFIDFYESKGWMIGKNKMKSWKAAVRTWEGRETETKSNPLNSVLVIN